MTPAPSEHRLTTLDSVRGIAAALVVMHHARLTIPETERLDFLSHVFPGGGAVLIFFVLSGVVLGMTFVYRDGERYLPYVIKRVTRIWPPFAVAVLISAALALVVGYREVGESTWWFNTSWSRPVTATMIADHLAMTGRTTHLNNPMWSLIHEMRISLVFPFLAAFVIWNWRAAVAATALLCVLSSLLETGLHRFDTLLHTSRFLVLFAFGLVVALNLDGLRHRVGLLGAPARAALWVVSLVVVAFSPEYYDTHSTVLGDLRLLAHGIAAGAVVVLAVTEGRAATILRSRIPVQLGRISYSLYLTHVVVIVTIVQALAGRVPVPLLVAAALVVSFVVADTFERFVERPTARFGRNVARRLRDA